MDIDGAIVIMGLIVFFCIGLAWVVFNDKYLNLCDNLFEIFGISISNPRKSRRIGLKRL